MQKSASEYLTLASTSRYRLQLLTQAGYAVKTCAPGVDENAVKNLGLSPLELSQKLAQEKAEAGFRISGDRYVIGSDQVACLGAKIFDKPGTAEKALATLQSLQGKAHQLFTSVYVITPRGPWQTTNITTLHMKSWNDTELKSYIEKDKPLDCSGSYRLEAAGIRLFSRIESSDFTAIQGLPMLELAQALDDLGFPRIF